MIEYREAEARVETCVQRECVPFADECNSASATIAQWFSARDIARQLLCVQRACIDSLLLGQEKAGHQRTTDDIPL